jgi:hypothetical protein
MADAQVPLKKIIIQNNFSELDAQNLLDRIKKLEDDLLKEQKHSNELKKENSSLKSKAYTQNLVKAELEKSFSAPQTKQILTQKRVNWSEEDIIKGLMLRALSTKSYQQIRRKQLFPVPSISTLKKWVSKLDCSPGNNYDLS